MMKKFSLSVLRRSLLAIYKSLVRPNLDYADINYEKPHKCSFTEKTGWVQYSACLVIRIRVAQI